MFIVLSSASAHLRLADYIYNKPNLLFEIPVVTRKIFCSHFSSYPLVKFALVTSNFRKGVVLSDLYTPEYKNV